MLISFGKCSLRGSGGRADSRACEELRRAHGGVRAPECGARHAIGAALALAEAVPPRRGRRVARAERERCRRRAHASAGAGAEEPAARDAVAAVRAREPLPHAAAHRAQPALRRARARRPRARLLRLSAFVRADACACAPGEFTRSLGSA